MQLPGRGLVLGPFVPAACVFAVLVGWGVVGAELARADDPPVTVPSQPRVQSTAGGLLGGVRPPVLTPEERAEAQVADELGEIAAGPGHEAAAGAIAQARTALARARARRLSGEPVVSARALAVARAAVELAGRQAALARERTAAGAAGRAREAAQARARAAHEALIAAQDERTRATQAPAPADAPPAPGDDAESP